MKFALVHRMRMFALRVAVLALSPLVGVGFSHAAGQAQGTVIFWNTFDNQTGLPVGGSTVRSAAANFQFTGAVNASRLTVEHSIVSTAPNALSVDVNGGGSAYLFKKYASGYSIHDLRFHVYLGRDYYIQGSYLILARTGPTMPGNNRSGHVIVVLGRQTNLYLTYWDSNDQKHYVWSKVHLQPGGWHTIDLAEQVGQTNGSLSFSVDGTRAASATGLKVGAGRIVYFAIGDRYTPRSTHTTGHLYFDDIVARS